MRPLIFITILAGAAYASATADYSHDELNYSFVVLADTHIGNGGGDPKSYELLQSVVDKINAMTKDENIQYVFIAGDVTDSAEHYAFDDAKKLLDGIKGPRVIPVIGNHDPWTYGEDYEEDEPTGDAYFVKTFSEYYEGLVWNDWAGPNPTQGWASSTFPSIEVRHGKQVFFALDWNSRRHAVEQLGYKGAMPGVQTHKFPGGTWNWFEDRLAVLAEDIGDADVEIVQVQHHPYRAPRPIPDKIYGWNKGQKKDMRSLLSKYFSVDKYFGVFAGHFHRHYPSKSGAFDEKEWKNFRQYETSACKETSEFTLVHVVDGKISECIQMYGNKDDTKVFSQCH